MTKLRDELAYPCVGEGFGNPQYHTAGLTKFELTAILGVAAVLGKIQTTQSPEFVAKTTLRYARALWDELEKEESA